MTTFTDFQGRQIRLTDERRQHILEHPEMTALEHELEQTLIEPEKVRRSQSDPSVILYYRYCKDTIVGEKWLCIVVKILINDAFILTVYLTNKLKSGESLR
ncbi:hypothetical protein [Phormidesmis priestleyi]|nr:hypothetical protein [Phormidesmis priestleyi]